jgi:uncharacterized protein YcbX
VDRAVHLSGLFVYPVKSLRGCAVASAAVDELGLRDDRRFLVVDDQGRFLTQRALPHMARVATALDERTLTLSAEGVGPIAVPRTVSGAAVRPVTIWKHRDVLAEDCGDAPANWLTDLLGVRCRLMRVGADFHRPVLKTQARPGDRIAATDAEPFLVIGEASLADLNARLVAQGAEAVPMNRFRPNLVVAGSAPFAEDTWPRLRIGGIVFRSGGPCARCIITTTDQLTGARGKEPLRTLAAYRRDPSDPKDLNFGQNLLHETKSGILRVGDSVEILPGSGIERPS